MQAPRLVRLDLQPQVAVAAVLDAVGDQFGHEQRDIALHAAEYQDA